MLYLYFTLFPPLPTTTTMNDFIMPELTLISRLVFAGILGAIIGLEREFRAKEAGLRTHFLVAVGSALFMIVSQYGFADGVHIPGIKEGDAARVAAQIVTGIGFIGAGAIMVQRHYVRGLTTAAGLWVVAAIGMCVGGGLFLLALTSTIFALIGLEFFRWLMHWVNLRIVEISFSANDSESINLMLNRIKEIGCHITNYKLYCLNSTGTIRVVLSARDRSRYGDANKMLNQLNNVPGTRIESIE